MEAQGKEAPKKLDFKSMNFSDIPRLIKNLVTGKGLGEEPMMTGQTGKYEINLVPDVKLKMIQAQKMRNLILFFCLIVGIGSVSVAAVLGGIKASQDITMTSQDAHLKELKDKISSFKELPQLLTLQNQLLKISEIQSHQKVLSRIFPILSTMIPNCADKSKDNVCVQEISIDLDSSTLSFDATANAGTTTDKIDYRVLEAFKKTVDKMTYDYGRYVDSQGKPIPTRCIIETDANGNALVENGSIYAIWTRGQVGCDPARDDYATDDDGSSTVSPYFLDGEDEDAEEEDTVTTSNPIVTSTQTGAQINNTLYIGNNSDFGVVSVKNMQDYNGDLSTKIELVPNEKIYRTPQFNLWYHDDSKEVKVSTASDGVADVAPQSTGATKYKVATYTYTPEMTTDGAISNIPHFESNCISYEGDDSGEEVKWKATNTCVLVPDGILIPEHANGKDPDNDDDLILSFSAVIEMDPAVFSYANKHLMTMSPNKQNVTDSYVQTDQIFSRGATTCAPDDAACNNAVNDANKADEEKE